VAEERGADWGDCISLDLMVSSPEELVRLLDEHHAEWTAAHGPETYHHLTFNCFDYVIQLMNSAAVGRRADWTKRSAALLCPLAVVCVSLFALVPSARRWAYRSDGPLASIFLCRHRHSYFGHVTRPLSWPLEDIPVHFELDGCGVASLCSSAGSLWVRVPAYTVAPKADVGNGGAGAYKITHGV
jgi:hypothetical protein